MARIVESTKRQSQMPKVETLNNKVPWCSAILLATKSQPYIRSTFLFYKLIDCRLFKKIISDYYIA
jgi:hypothetical protein